MANLLRAQYLKGNGSLSKITKHAAKELSDVTHCLQVANIAEAVISGAFWLQKPPCATCVNWKGYCYNGMLQAAGRQAEIVE